MGMIQSATFTNIGPFKSLAIPFPQRDPQLLAIVGTGKTSALRGLALALGNGARNVITRSLLRDGCTTGGVTVRPSNGLAPAEMVMQKRNNYDGENIANRTETSGLVVAYGVLRSCTDTCVSKFGGYNDIASLFDDAGSLARADAVFGTLEHGMLIAKVRGGEKWRIAAYEAACGALATILGAKKVEMDSDGLCVDGRRLVRSGTGTVSLAAWVTDLMARWLDRAKSAGTEIGPNFPEQIEATCIVDAIDQHLHPRQQVDLIERLRKVFPRVTFIVSVESPMTLCGCRPGEVVVLDAERGTATVPTVDPRLRTGSELYSKFFGIRELFPAELGQALNRYHSYAADPYRDDREDTVMAAARAKLDAAGIDPGFEPEARTQS